MEKALQKQRVEEEKQAVITERAQSFSQVRRKGTSVYGGTFVKNAGTQQQREQVGISLNTYANKSWYLNYSRGNALTYCDMKDFNFKDQSKQIQSIKAELAKQFIEEPKRNEVAYMVYIMVVFGYAIHLSYLSRTDFLVPCAFIALLANEEMNFIKK